MGNVWIKVEEEVDCYARYIHVPSDGPAVTGCGCGEDGCTGWTFRYDYVQEWEEGAIYDGTETRVHWKNTKTGEIRFSDPTIDIPNDSEPPEEEGDTSLRFPLLSPSNPLQKLK